MRVESAGALVWSGTAEASDVSVALARDLRLPGLTLRPGVPVSELSLPLRGSPAVDAELADGVWLRAVEVPCDGLALEESIATAELPDGPERGDVLPRGRSLRVHARPGGPSVLLRLEHPAALRLARAERRGEWLRVRRELASGASLDGWVRASSVEIVDEQSLAGSLSDIGSGSGCGRGSSHTYRGPATLLAGAEVRTAVDGVVWAVASADVEVVVAIRWGAEWAQIERVSGLLMPDEPCPSILEIAFVPRSSLRLPPGTP